MKNTFSYFPGMFENPAPAKIILKRNQKYYEILAIYYNYIYIYSSIEHYKRYQIKKKEDLK